MEENKTPTLEELTDKLSKIEQALKEKDDKISALETKNNDLQHKLAGLRVDGLVKQVEPKVVEVEEVKFDFDL